MVRTIYPAILALCIGYPVLADDVIPPEGHVERALFTTAINGLEPVDNLSELNGDSEQVFFFTELRNMDGSVLTHSWEHKGEVIAEVELNVEGPRWRTWSSKRLTPGMRGSWAVVIINESGDILAEKVLDYNPGDLISETTAR